MKQPHKQGTTAGPRAGRPRVARSRRAPTAALPGLALSRGAGSAARRREEARRQLRRHSPDASRVTRLLVWVKILRSRIDVDSRVSEEKSHSRCVSPARGLVEGRPLTLGARVRVDTGVREKKGDERVAAVVCRQVQGRQSLVVLQREGRGGICAPEPVPARRRQEWPGPADSAHLCSHVCARVRHEHLRSGDVAALPGRVVEARGVMQGGAAFFLSSVGRERERGLLGTISRQQGYR